MGPSPFSSLSIPFLDVNVGYVRSNGSNTSGTGTPSYPVATWQKAIDLGYTNFDFGVGSFGAGIFPTSVNVAIRGRGLNKTTLGAVTILAGASPFFIQDTGFQSCLLSDVTFSKPTSGGFLYLNQAFATGTISAIGTDAGAAAGYITLANSFASIVGLQGFAGSPGDDSNPGGIGGAGGNLDVFGVSAVNEIYALGGDGGIDGGAGQGDGGPGGLITLRGPIEIITALSLAGGAGAIPGANGQLFAHGVVRMVIPDTGTFDAITGCNVDGTFYTNSYP